ncbi:MAG: M48 family metalloprotease [Verrucomicrobiota bacterium]
MQPPGSLFPFPSIRRPASWLALILCLPLCQCAARPLPAEKKTPLPASAMARWQRVTPRLAAAVPRDRNDRPIDWKFIVVPAKGRNARSLPSGRVEVTEGMLTFVRTDGELAAVLAHEMSHVTLRHGIARSMASWGVILGGAALAVLAHHHGGSGGWEAAGMGTAAVFTVSLTGLTAYQRSQEFAADTESVALLLRAGYPARSAADFWELYTGGRRAEGRTGGGWWKSHPSDAERVQRLRALAGKHGS